MSVLSSMFRQTFEKYKEPDCDLSHCLKQAAAEQSHVLRFHGSRAAKLKTAIQSLDHAKTIKILQLPCIRKFYFWNL